MALTQQEQALGKQIKAQGGTKDDFREALTEFRKRQEVQTIQQPQQPVETIQENITVNEPVIPKTKEEIESKEGLKGFISESGQALKERGSNIKDIYATSKEKQKTSDIKAQDLQKEGKNIQAFLESMKGAANSFGSAYQTVGQLAGGAGDVIWEGVENTIQKFTPEKAEEAITGVVSDAINSGTIQGLLESYGNFREKNPELARNIEATGNIGGFLSAFSKGGGAATRAKLSGEKMEQASGKIGDFIKPTKEQTKQTTEKITPDFLNKLKSGEIKPGTREEIQALAKVRVEDFGQQINKVVDSGLEGVVKRDDLLDILDELKSQGVVGGKVVDEEIVSATDKMADIISSFPESIPADKARELRQVFDSAVFKTKGLISEESLTLKNVIKKKLADNIRKQLSETNPKLAELNKEFAFYTNLDDLLEQTIRRTSGQAEGGGIETKRAGTLRAIGGGAGAGAGVMVGGPQGGFIGGALGVAAANKLDNILANPKYKLIDAKKKAQLSDAIVNGNIQKAKEIINSMAKKVGLAETADEE